MARHAVLLTWRNMEPTVLPDFIHRALQKYGDNFHRIYFDGMAKEELWARDRRQDAIKVFISGHGDTGVDHITDHTQQATRTVDDLVDLLRHALDARATRACTSGECEVEMLSCLFARTPDGRATTSPAARLHARLAEQRVFVDFVGRSESIAAGRGGRRTRSPYGAKVDVALRGPGEDPRQVAYRSRVSYTKVRFTFESEARVARLCDYRKDPSGCGTYIEASTLEGRRLLWADHAVDRLLDEIELGDIDGDTTGRKTLVPGRGSVLKKILELYDLTRSPIPLHGALTRLVESDDPDEQVNFRKHRDPLTALLPGVLPRKAALIRRLLEAYPRV